MQFVDVNLSPTCRQARMLLCKLSMVCRNGDDTFTFEEVQRPFLRLFQFLVGKPGQRLGVGELVSGFDKLREPPIISASLRQLLTPVLDTFPR